jgi:ferric-dicitrate binding protein FerR (iron transport regulator)
MDSNFEHMNKWEDLIIRFFNNELSINEEQELHNWINESADNYAIFEQYRAVLVQSTSQINDSKAGELAWQKISPSIEERVVTLKIFTLTRYLKIAAAVLLIFMAGFFTSKYYMNQNTFSPSTVCEISTPLGSKTFCTLPDGSQVWLNAGSKLVYPKNFDEKERKVTLVGEAFFKVKTNKNKPFIVATSQMNVRAYGTSFNVKAYPDEKVISTTLVEGIVKVDGIEGNKKFEYTLKPSQNITIVKDVQETEKMVQKKQVAQKQKEMAIAESQTEIIKEVKTELHTSWKDIRWNIEGESLNSLAVLLERRFNTKIFVEAEELNKYKFTGTIQNETLEQVMQFLSFTTPLNYKIGKGEVWWGLDHKKAIQYSKILNN